MTRRTVVLTVLLVVSVVSGMALGAGTVAGELDVSPGDLPGSGTADDPYQISNASELQAMEDDLSAHYELVSDIDASDTADWNGGNGFDPVGFHDENDSSTRFTGSFDGNGHTISNLTIDRGSTNHAGLFGLIDETAVVENVYLENVDITGSDLVGGLVGANGDGNNAETTIFNSTVTGSVAGNSRAGGLVGWNDGEIRQSTANVSVTVEQDDNGYSMAGGLVGFQYANGTISTSYAVGNVSSAGSQNGGFVGYTIGSVNTSYSTGAVRGGTATGGFSGTNGGNISNSYSAGEVSGDASTGGFSGVNGGTITDSYWDTVSSGQESSDGGTGLKTAEMRGDQATSNMNGFDFTNTWDVLTGDIVSYPYLLDNRQHPAPGRGEGGFLNPSEFQVAIDATNSPVAQGETLEVTATVTNEGQVPMTQTIELRDFDGTVVDSTEIALDSGISETVHLSWTTDSDDAGTAQITVESEDDTATSEVWVQEPADFSVAIDATNSPVVAGETLEVNATVSNEGDLSGTQTIELQNSQGSLVDTESVTLDGGDSTTQTLSWSTSTGDAGNESITVRSENDSATREVTIQEPVNFLVTIDATNSPVVPGEPLDVTATVTNEGEVQRTQTIILQAFNGTVVDSTTVTLDEGHYDTVNLSWSTNPDNVGTDAIAVSSEDHRATQEVTVQHPGKFTVAIENTNAPIRAGENLDVTTRVTNTGGEKQTQDISLENLAGDVVDTERLTLDGGESATVTLSWATREDEADSGQITVACDDGSDTTAVTISESGIFEVEITDYDDAVEQGDTINLTAEVTNTGGSPATHPVEFRVDGTGETVEKLELKGGETETIAFGFVAEEVGENRVLEVASSDDSASVTVTVSQPSTPESDPSFEGSIQLLGAIALMIPLTAIGILGYGLHRG